MICTVNKYAASPLYVLCVQLCPSSLRVAPAGLCPCPVSEQLLGVCKCCAKRFLFSFCCPSKIKAGPVCHCHSPEWGSEALRASPAPLWGSEPTPKPFRPFVPVQVQSCLKAFPCCCCQLSRGKGQSKPNCNIGISQKQPPTPRWQSLAVPIL